MCIRDRLRTHESDGCECESAPRANSLTNDIGISRRHVLPQNGTTIDTEFSQVHVRIFHSINLIRNTVKSVSDNSRGSLNSERGVKYSHSKKIKLERILLGEAGRESLNKSAEVVALGHLSN